MSLPIPASGKVFTLEGLNTAAGIDFEPRDYMATFLQGKFSTAPYTRARLDYPASDSPLSINTGVANLDKAVRNTSGQKIILAHSQGAQVVSRWINLYRLDVTAPSAANLMFILLGNPLRGVGGFGIGKPEVDGVTGVATRTDGPWTVVDIAQRYDGWADFPTDVNNKAAMAEAISGAFSIHTNYDPVSVTDPTLTQWTVGNTTYVLTKAETVPRILRGYFLVGTEGDRIKATVRAKIAAGYSNRPGSDPAILPGIAPNVFWKRMLTNMGYA